MTRPIIRFSACALGALLFASVPGGAEAQGARDRPLTIKRHKGGAPRTGIEVRDGGNEIVAWGGFGANGYGRPPMGAAAARREAANESVRLRTGGIYGYGFDGLGGTGFDTDRGVGGYDNPFYGNAYNSYVGYNGVPTALAFGPGFASRHITSDDNDLDVPGPTPAELGYEGHPDDDD